MSNRLGVDSVVQGQLSRGGSRLFSIGGHMGEQQLHWGEAPNESETLQWVGGWWWGVIQMHRTKESAFVLMLEHI